MDVEGPLLDILQLTRQVVERIWWNGFWWGALAGGLVGFVVGGLFVAQIASALRR